jgi:predicted enzyme related to lactoylglutathione lyase
MNMINLGNIMIDCPDEQSLCEFYHKLLGWEQSIMFGRPALQSKKGIVFLFMEENGYIPPVWPEENDKQQKQMHFDFQVPDVKTAVDFAISIGASKAANQFGNDEFVTMFDPAGHPFCLCAESNMP